MRWTTALATATLVTASSALVASAADAVRSTPSRAKLTADVNRDGRLTAADDAGRASWSQARGAIFLPNLDDDGRRCRVDPADLEKAGRAVDDKLAACHDAADERINGPRDAADLAPLKIDALRNLSAAATGTMTIRSGNVWDFAGVPTPRPAGRLLYRDLRGPDVGVVQELAKAASPQLDDLLNMGGNIEMLPPYAGYPHGRIVYGSGERRPDPGFITMVTSQGYQPPIVYDVSWLMIGHADETTHVVRADNARGWTLAVADPRLAMRLLHDVQRRGGGSQRLFADTNSPSKPTVDEIVANGAADNETAARHIDDQLKILLTATGLRPDELVRLPVLFDRVPGAELYKALTPGLVNGLSLTDRHFAAPDPHGPKLNGRDLFRHTAERALARNGVRIHWVENFFWSHLGGGEVHCATNALRDTYSTTPWWKGA
ncbi:hypothetical protein HPO96_15690 [Kribbella sandramycini]|uniref:Protein-arginine deiminase C-terminal domain-containing protein n=1 Tax=Kribbella sandramycini TaxID=60450 RepID=A0A7Y4P133_9ACTN|nr:protein-arginine deiminase family protein [Kribbella sandramycini]MBB6565421.1 hypothetical protein [Kribbella sandramycini]NOL41689.1 hypothetical protein [Kribbella sandramycini]